MEKIELTIDNKKIEVDKGTTVLKQLVRLGLTFLRFAIWNFTAWILRTNPGGLYLLIE